jgi:membrane protein required for colicin V production
VIIDIVAVILLLLALFRGYKHGFVIAIVSSLAVIVGVAAALKLSAVVAKWLQAHINFATKWLPFISFLIVLIAVIFLVRWLAVVIDKTLKAAFLGWANKLAGILLYIAVYFVIFSVLLFYLTQLNIISKNTIDSSHTYRFIQPWGPIVINSIGKIIPIFKDLFEQLEHFFGQLADRM